MTKRVRGEFAVEIQVPNEGIEIEPGDGGTFVLVARGPTQKDAEDALKRLGASITQEA